MSVKNLASLILTAKEHVCLLPLTVWKMTIWKMDIAKAQNGVELSQNQSHITNANWIIQSRRTTQ